MTWVLVFLPAVALATAVAVVWLGFHIYELPSVAARRAVRSVDIDGLVDQWGQDELWP